MSARNTHGVADCAFKDMTSYMKENNIRVFDINHDVWVVTPNLLNTKENKRLNRLLGIGNINYSCIKHVRITGKQQHTEIINKHEAKLTCITELIERAKPNMGKLGLEMLMHIKNYCTEVVTDLRVIQEKQP